MYIRFWKTKKTHQISSEIRRDLAKTCLFSEQALRALLREEASYYLIQTKCAVYQVKFASYFSLYNWPYCCLLRMQPQYSSTVHNNDNNITCITLQCTRPGYKNDATEPLVLGCYSFTTSLEDTYEHICRHSPGVTPFGKDNQIHPVGSDTLCQWNSCASFLCIH